MFFSKKPAVLPTPPAQEKAAERPAQFIPYFSPQLKVKICSLAAEARIIKRMEKRLFKAVRRNPKCQEQAQSLFWHRIGDVRWASRDTLLAYGFLRGHPYKTMEPKRYSDPDWKAIANMVSKYGHGDGRAIMQHFEQWKQSAGEPPVKPPREKRARPTRP